VIVILAPCRRELERFPSLYESISPMRWPGWMRDTCSRCHCRDPCLLLGKGFTQAVMKAELISALIREVQRQEITHAELARRSDLSRTTVTGILTGSLQKVTIDRLLRLVEAAGLEARIRIRRAA
jgi:predicted XRE-type DNA-binding protein